MVPGGLDLPNQGTDDITAIANAAILVSIDIHPAATTT
jgi:hypothetical protein